MSAKCDPAAHGTLWTSQDTQEDVRWERTIRQDSAGQAQGNTLTLL